MGNVFGKQETRLLIFGPSGGGKTTLIYKLKPGATLDTIVPTLGVNAEKVEHKEIPLLIWDIGWQDRIMALWRHYFQNVRGLICVVDSTDRPGLAKAREELHRVLNDDALREAALLVFANKQDLPNSMSTGEIQDAMELTSFRHRKFHVQSSCALSGDGISVGMDWLCSQLQTS